MKEEEEEDLKAVSIKAQVMQKREEREGGREKRLFLKKKY